MTGKRRRPGAATEASAGELQRADSLRPRNDDGADNEADGGANAGTTLPPASEEDWQRRIAKRTGAVATIKGTAEYQAFFARGGASALAPGVPAPKTPDPQDRSVSKRNWESSVMEWRTALRDCVPSDSLDLTSFPSLRNHVPAAD